MRGESLAMVREGETTQKENEDCGMSKSQKQVQLGSDSLHPRREWNPRIEGSQHRTHSNQAQRSTAPENTAAASLWPGDESPWFLAAGCTVAKHGDTQPSRRDDAAPNSHPGPAPRHHWLLRQSDQADPGNRWVLSLLLRGLPCGAWHVALSMPLLPCSVAHPIFRACCSPAGSCPSSGP